MEIWGSNVDCQNTVRQHFVTGADAVQVLHGQNRLCSFPARISWVCLEESRTHKQQRLREELQHSAVHARPELSTIRCSQRTIGTANQNPRSFLDLTQNEVFELEP